MTVPTPLCDSDTLFIVVAAGNPPVAVVDGVTVPEDTTNVTIDVVGNDTDPDNNIDPGTVTVLSGPTSGGTGVPNGTGGILYNPPLNFNGPDTIVYQICDSTGLCGNDTVFINVTPVADPPVAMGVTGGA